MTKDRPIALECEYLLTEGQILGQKLRMGEKQGPGHPGKEGNEEKY